MRTTIILASTVLMLTGTPATAQTTQPQDLRVRYEKAFHTEMGERDPGAALPLYEQVLEDANASSELAALALLRMGFCLEKLGRPGEATNAWKRAILEHEEQAEVAASARVALRDLGARMAASAPGAAGEDDWPEPRGLDTVLEVIFEGPPLDEVARILAEEGEINLVIDPAVLPAERFVSISFRGLTLREALDLLARQQGLAWAELHGVVYLASPQNLWRYRQRRWLGATLTRPNDAATLEVMEHRKLSLDFLDTPLEDVFAFLREASGLDLILTPEASSRIAGRSVTLVLQEVLVRDVLRLLLLPLDLEYRHQHGAVVVDVLRDPIQVAFERPVTLAFRDAALTDVAATLSEAGGVPVVLDPETIRLGEEAGHTVTLQVEQIPFRAALMLLTRLQELDFAVLHGVVYVAPPALLARYGELSWPEPSGWVDSATEAVLAHLKTTWVAVDFLDAPLTVVMDFLRGSGELNRILDTGVAAEDESLRVTLKGAGLSLEQVLRLSLMPHGLTYDLVEGVIVIRHRQE